LGGLWANPGLIEGVAVAASPDADELTDGQWARAMLDAGILPPLSQVFSMGFLGAHASKSYTIAGALVRYVLETRGAEAVRAWYSGATAEHALGTSLDGLDTEWRSHLQKETLPAAAQAYALARFERKGVFRRRCPHEVDALRRDAEQCRDAYDTRGAIARYEAALHLDESDGATRLGLAATLLGASADGEGARKNLDQARTLLAPLTATAGTPTHASDRARELEGDALARSGQLEEAARVYEALAAQTLNEDLGRTLEVKAALARVPALREAFEALFVAADGADRDKTVVLTRALRTPQPSPWVAYLYGRQVLAKGELDEARRWLEPLTLPAAPDDEGPARVPAAAEPTGAQGNAAASSQSRLTERVQRETLRLLARVACELGDAALHARVHALVQSDAGPFAQSAGGRRAHTLAFLRRCLRSDAL
jgi:hypothetical protein